MNEYQPDCWVILRFNSAQFGVVDKILAGWYSSYMSGSSWKLNSGVAKVEDFGNYYEVTGPAGSIYRLYKHQQKLGSPIDYIYDSFVRKLSSSESDASVEILDSFE